MGLKMNWSAGVLKIVQNCVLMDYKQRPTMETVLQHLTTATGERNVLCSVSALCAMCCVLCELCAACDVCHVSGVCAYCTCTYKITCIHCTFANFHIPVHFHIVNFRILRPVL